MSKKKSEWIELVSRFTPSNVDAEGVAMDLAEWLEVELEEDVPAPKLPGWEVGLLWDVALDRNPPAEGHIAGWERLYRSSRKVVADVANQAFEMGLEGNKPRTIEWEERHQVDDLPHGTVAMTPGGLSIQKGRDAWTGSGFDGVEYTFDGQLRSNEAYYPLTILFTPEES